MEKKIVLIDGHSILTRAFFGVPHLTGPDGRPTNAVYGFINIMLSILDEERPDYIAVAFDLKEPTFRHKMFEGYKGTRKPMPEELHLQVPIIKEVLTSMGIPIVTLPGYEADDILGTIAKSAESSGLRVCLVSGDRDLLQIATDRIMVRIPKTKAGGTTIENYYEADVKALYGVSGQHFIELKALMGDSSDNIPGVPKVGEKTAMELMKTYGSLEGIYDNIENITKKAVKQSLADNRELADLSLKLATICTAAPIDFSIEDAAIHDLFNKESYIAFKELGFKQLLSRFDGGAAASAGETPAVSLIDTEEEAKAVLGGISDGVVIGLYPIRSQAGVIALGLSFGADKPVTFCLHGAYLTDDFIKALLEALRAKGTVISAAGIYEIYPFMDWVSELKSEDIARLFDINLAAYLLNPLKSDYTCEDIATEHLSMTVPGYKEVIGKEDPALLFMTKRDEIVNFTALMALTCLRAQPVLSDKLRETGMELLYSETELPLSYILFDMQREGIRVDKDALFEYGSALSGRISELEKAIHESAGEPFNINSPKQLGEILFGKMGLKGGKKTKTGYSTAADVLEKLAPDYRIVADILEYRGLTKLKSTYADGLIDYIGQDGRIHTHFNQTVTATGRLSSSDPNLQNIPMRTELGRRIRKVFIPGDGCIFTDADYSQIELRLLAHMSGDQNLIESYKEEADIHRITASKVFNTPFDQVTDLQRRNAKAVNFGIVYGISSFGLSQDLSISRKEAEGYIKEYFATYPAIKGFLDKCVSDAKERGYALTLYGRRRPVPELKSSNFMQRSFGERVAMNAPIQGTAADIMKFAMIRVYRALKSEGLKSKLILQIHDELLIETLVSEAPRVKELLQREMERAADLLVRLETDLHTGSDWYEAK